MRLVQNSGNDRVLEILRSILLPDSNVDIASSELSLFAYLEIHDFISKSAECRLIIPDPLNSGFQLLGNDSDRASRNQLKSRWLADICSNWISEKCQVHQTIIPLPQSIIIVKQPKSGIRFAITGTCPITTAGFGLTPGNQFGLIQYTESPEETGLLEGWFSQLWKNTSNGTVRQNLLSRIRELSEHRAPETIYNLVLANIFARVEDELDEDRIVKSDTGIKNSQTWKKLFRFQRDGVIGAIDKLERFGGCIIADSVGLGKTFEALAVIKYYELRNQRVLVLCPKRLRENWSIYKFNDKRNILSGDRLNYDILNHTDLNRDNGSSGDLDLAHINWGNYDLIVIDESHNFRNKNSPRAGGETRYDKLMRKIIKEGVKTRVLMLSATPVNNRLADLKNQIAFATEGNDEALVSIGISNIGATVRLAQTQFNRWLQLEESERRSGKLMDMLGFDYFHLLDTLTIARSRKHIERYYDAEETGKFPERLRPINIKSDVDVSREFRPISEINDEIRRLKLGAYAPLRYILPKKQAAYDLKYSQTVQNGKGLFRQADREESLIHLLRVNLLKRMESSVHSFALTIKRQLDTVEDVLSRIDSLAETIEEVNIQNLDVEDPTFENMFIGTKVKVLLQDVDRVRWRQDLIEDRDRLRELVQSAQRVSTDRDAKLNDLKKIIKQKHTRPLNAGNRKIIIFSAFSDTVHYLYHHLSNWALNELGFYTASITGSGRNRTTLPGLRNDMATILSAFAPRAKERPAELASEGEIDLLIATDCISEGQNLQDCDFLVNYDIHWNPVRIIQRFGRIDRIGSPNKQIQLVNFWPNMELEEYINLEQRVSGRMVLLDISASGEENVIEQHSGNQMNDLEYRRKQLLKLQDAVIDLEDLSSGVSIADLTLNDFRMDLARLPKQVREKLSTFPLGTMAVVPSDGVVPPGAIFCLRATGETVDKSAEPNYPLAPYYLVHIADDGQVLNPFTQARAILDSLKRLCSGRSQPIEKQCQQFDQSTRRGERMEHYQNLLSAAVTSIIGRKEERKIASLFSLGGTYARKGEFSGINDFEVVIWVAIIHDGETP
ncbi:helicase-related protein [Tuwongella immobilis]|uniref:Helicase n=1 Tax=Tuwongella immobilis TaxID=692036 RepID=A0A6C2YHS6_9BACT|nr:helicase-related protein [Tuwongella immobilis]VIP01080.1 helicase : Helicase domain protein OS=Pelobacter propionicus (strain DSM 2379) GN=Ppro_0240 PE=4 SV=1: SNF2_N: Helicase_C [Tuwongella immobilis]VTR97585.1 helicase : Helicase domain protein OS=Pelobacter propionicus (strain DSM 2379) GN=Ppro_0240 PE=4 SV=1: SNF2_N: Helicase_C [Tuwongella immobilis]